MSTRATRYACEETSKPAPLAAQTVRLQHRAGLDRSAGARMGVMQEDGKLWSHSFAVCAYRVREQDTLHIVRQAGPIADNRLA
jgi:hypothetical protein